LLPSNRSLIRYTMKAVDILAHSAARSASGPALGSKSLSPKPSPSESISSSSSSVPLRIPGLPSISLGASLGASPPSPDWETHGYANLPFDSAFELALGTAPVTLDLASPPDSCVDHHLSGLQRQIPEGHAFTLGWFGPIPSSSSFELKELTPAILQAGTYMLKITWLAAEHGEYVNLNALKLLEVKLPKRTVEA
jgi:hypothetical protein